MKATVVTTFKDSVSKKVFRVGDEFPLENVEQERIDLLTKPHPKTNKIYLYVEGNQEQYFAEGEEIKKADEQQQEPSNEDETKADVAPADEEVKPKTTRRKPKPEPSNEGE